MALALYSSGCFGLNLWVFHESSVPFLAFCCPKHNASRKPPAPKASDNKTPQGFSRGLVDGDDDGVRGLSGPADDLEAFSADKAHSRGGLTEEGWTVWCSGRLLRNLGRAGLFGGCFLPQQALVKLV